MASTIHLPLSPASMSDAELRYLSKDSEYNNVIIDVEELRRRVWLDLPQRWTTPSAESSVGLGNIDRIPLEMQLHLFSVTPLSGLIALRATNSHAKHLVEQWEPFKTVMTHGADAVRALLATGAGRLWTTGQVLDVLFTTSCEVCGEHGEILHLLQLKRCCFRCLSQERQLLATTSDYARDVMGLRADDLKDVPSISTVPQRSFWGFPTGGGPVFDYQGLLRAVERKGETGQAERGGRLGRQSTGPPVPGFLPVVRTGIFLGDDRRSVQRRPAASLQCRRGQPALTLPRHVVRPCETVYVQHGCAVRVPGMTRKRARLRDGGFKHSVTTVNAVHCAGCASYWNYHGSLPFQHHRLHPHDKHSRDTALTRHVARCVYARLHWIALHNPWAPPMTREAVDAFLADDRRTYRPRNPTTSSIAENNATFEQIPVRPLWLMEDTDADADTFQTPYSWPGGVGTATPAAATGAVTAGDKRDLYWDGLVSQEAISQTNWACAHPNNGSVCLFRGPVSLLLEKRTRYNRKFWCEGTKNRRQPEWGFDRF